MTLAVPALAPEIGLSLLDEIDALPDEWLEEMLADLGETVVHAALRHPSATLRPKQAMEWEKDWRNRVIMGGRGVGKTRAGTTAIVEAVFQQGHLELAIVARTSADLKHTIVNGPSGLLSLPARYRPTITDGRAYEARWPNGARCVLYSADKPDAIRGLSASFVWCDEFAAYKVVKARAGEVPVSVFDNIRFATRERSRTGARILITTTPRNRAEFLRVLQSKRSLVTRESTFANAANLDEEALAEYREDYTYLDEQGNLQYTTTGRQELLGEIIDDVDGALLRMSQVEDARLLADRKRLARACERVIIAVDPSLEYGPENDYTGIVVAGLLRGRVYLLESLGIRAASTEWAARVGALYGEWGAREVVVEVNVLGHTAKTLLNQALPGIRVHEERAVKGKRERAEPLRGLFEQGRVRFVSELPPRLDSSRSYPARRGGSRNAHLMLEEQLRTFPLEGTGTHDDVPDAMVYAVRRLVTDAPVRARIGESI